jgi:hypothetical protein
MKLQKGATRWVFVGRKRAYKIPSLSSYKQFLQGLLCNMNEAIWSKSINLYPHLCPIMGKIPFGLLVIMPAVSICTRQMGITGGEEWEYYKDICMNKETGIAFPQNDWKASNFGVLNGKIVCIDYGW